LAGHKALLLPLQQLLLLLLQLVRLAEQAALLQLLMLHLAEQAALLQLLHLAEQAVLLLLPPPFQGHQDLEQLLQLHLQQQLQQQLPLQLRGLPQLALTQLMQHELLLTWVRR
jgi:hypothetical protein